MLIVNCFALLVLLLRGGPVSAAPDSDTPPGVIYGLLPDPFYELPEWKEPFTGPDIPVTYRMQQLRGSGEEFLPEQVALFPATRNFSHLFVQWVVPLSNASLSSASLSSSSLWTKLMEGDGRTEGRKDEGRLVNSNGQGALKLRRSRKLAHPPCLGVRDEADGPSFVVGRVLYGLSEDSLSLESTCTGKQYSYALGSIAAYTSGLIFQCAIGPLLPRRLYFYSIFGLPRVFNFTSLPQPGPEVPLRLGLMADVGQTVNSSATLDHAIESDYDFMLLAGDVSYADNYGPPCAPFNGVDVPRNSPAGPKTCGEGGMRWDSWGRLAEKLQANVPVAYVPGNHELEVRPQFLQLEPWVAYAARTPALLDDVTDTTPLHSYPPARSPFFYSLDVGPVHIIGLNSYDGFSKYTIQHQWLQADLCSINRDLTPWVIVFLHAPLYNSDVSHYLEGEAMRRQIEPWLYNATVDLVIAGHVHAYERSHPVYEMKRDVCGPIHITVGDGGNDEGVAGPFIEPQPVYSAYREDSFGHSELSLLSSATARYTWWRNGHGKKVKGDDLLLQNKHFLCGPKKPDFC
eukprot:TRINITY_DN9242_c0_g1_i2.p1 TRINITY_DN9242_c0_g1~~TRINITY_DN9242_c0_g1_i2.p1  ORF type:complete len:571 (-),score=113.53 TRINITY_DN9242_c0_g1_i2:56-1768(-)